jgi:hypothetical protein
VNCLEVREQLTEYALGTLAPEEARRVERHLEWCEGCRKELAELLDGMAPLALTVPEANPPRHLEERVVTRLMAASGRWKGASQRGIRALVTATAAAMLVAVGALSWAIAERQNAVDVKQEVAGQLEQANNFIKALQAVGATPYTAVLRSTSGDSQASGTVIVYSGRSVNDFVLLQAVLPGKATASYSFELTDRTGHQLSGGRLAKTNNTDAWVFVDRTGQNLSHGVSVLVLDDSTGAAVLTGVLEPAESGP